MMPEAIRPPCPMECRRFDCGSWIEAITRHRWARGSSPVSRASPRGISHSPTTPRSRTCLPRKRISSTGARKQTRRDQRAHLAEIERRLNEKVKRLSAQVKAAPADERSREILVRLGTPDNKPREISVNYLEEEPRSSFNTVHHAPTAHRQGNAVVKSPRHNGDEDESAEADALLIAAIRQVLAMRITFDRREQCETWLEILQTRLKDC